MPKGTIEFKPSKPHEIPTSFNGNNGITANIDTSMSGVDSAMFSQTTFLGTDGEDQKYRHLKYIVEHDVGSYIVIENKDDEAIVYLYSKSGAQLSRSIIPNRLPSTDNQKNKYLFLNAQGKLVWNTISGEYYSGVGIEIDDAHNVNLLYDTNYFKIVNGQLTLNTESIATKTDLTAKQDTIQFITLTSLSGELLPATLNLLKASRVNRLIYNSMIYYLSTIDGNQRVYTSKAISTTDQESLNTITINMTSGRYQISSAIDKYLLDHINDTIVHVSIQDRQRWDNKVSATAERLPLTADYELRLENNK